ncbi:MAG: hypothetical protein QG626_852 [Patescibacteria group bacterium]|nr:hypothetical protein [Patescibacteria group bacterium]
MRPAIAGRFLYKKRDRCERSREWGVEWGVRLREAGVGLLGRVELRLDADEISRLRIELQMTRASAGGALDIARIDALRFHLIRVGRRRGGGGRGHEDREQEDREDEDGQIGRRIADGARTRRAQDFLQGVSEVNTAAVSLADLRVNFKCYNRDMFHLHNPYMKGTKFDILVGIALFGFIVFILVILFAPMKALSRERDVVRTADVRSLMTSVLQLELIDPEAYARLVADVQGQDGLRVVLGTGDCSGFHGLVCSDAVTADVCLLAGTYFPNLLLTAAPVDPKTSSYSEEVTGYYLQVLGDQLEVGACGSTGDPIFLRKSLN